jgi:outer membrane protein TolC
MVAAAGAPALAQAPPSAPPPRQPAAVFLGSVPVGQPTAEPLRLTILDVINRALENNLGLLLSDDARGRAEGARWKAMGGMLPTINGRVSETRQLIDLAAYGFPLPEGIPPIVGPFNLFDARVYVTQPIVDLRALNDVRAERHNVAAAAYTTRARAGWSSSSRPTRICRRSPMRHARTSPARSCSRRRRCSRRPAISSKAGSSPGSTCCGPKSN